MSVLKQEVLDKLAKEMGHKSWKERKEYWSEPSCDSEDVENAVELALLLRDEEIVKAIDELEFGGCVKVKDLENRLGVGAKKK